MKKVDIIIPAYNESKILEASLEYLYEHIKKIKNYKINVIIGENGSKDNTFELGKKLAKDKKRFPNLKAVHLEDPSRDGVLKDLWGASDADVLLYMDADMSTHPRHTEEMIKAIAEEGYDVAIGSRMKKGAKVDRPFIRRFMSKMYYSVVLPIILPVGVEDTQCGFKAINQKVAKSLLKKLVKENGFLDTELVAASNHRKYKIKEIPVEWAEAERQSTMSVYNNVPKFLRNTLKTRAKIRRGYYN